MVTGEVINIFDTDLVEPKVKRCIIVGQDSECVGTIYINTDKRKLPHTLQGSQLPLETKHCPFIDYDCFADCSFIQLRVKSKLNEILQRDPKRIIGIVPGDIMRNILQTLANSDTIDRHTLKRCGLA